MWGCSSETIINLAELNAIEYNDDTDNNYVFVPPVNLFVTEIGLMMFDSLNTLMIFDLEERFLDNKIGVGIYNVSLDKAREIALQLR